MKAFAAVVIVGLVCALTGGPAGAAEGTKVFLKDCRLTMLASGNRGLGIDFVAFDSGSECDAYVLRGISLVSTNGQKVSTGVAANDGEPDPDFEYTGLMSTNTGFAYGTVNVYIPYRSRCDRYRLYPNDTVRRTESHLCRSATS